MSRRGVMQAARWFFISLPFVGLAWVIAEIMIRNRHALVEMVIDSEAFARAPAPPIETKESGGRADTVPSGLEAHG
jgi:hypothetical protein